ncbi:MAG: pyruvate formate lyase family protein, partial [Prolixibacteraceae bacterium]
MNQRIENLLDRVFRKTHDALRQNIDEGELLRFTSSLKEQKLSDIARAQKRLTWVLEKEQPVILPDEKIVFTRTVRKIPEIFTEDEWTGIRKAHYIHEMGRVCNICSDYSYTIEVGLEQRRREALEALEKFRVREELKAVSFLESVIRAIDDIERLAGRYADLALKSGREDLFLVLTHVPRYGARSFHEALQFFRILHFSLWASGNYHNTVGRFDQYMLKYLDHDLSS